MASSKAMQARDQMSAGGPYPDPEYANMKSIWHFLVEDNISIITQSSVMEVSKAYEAVSGL